MCVKAKGRKPPLNVSDPPALRGYYIRNCHKAWWTESHGLRVDHVRLLLSLNPVHCCVKGKKKSSQRLCFGKKRQINHTWQEWYHVLWRSEVIYHKRKKQQTHVKRSAEFRFKFEGKSSRTEKKLLIGKTHKWMTSHLKAILIYYLIYLFI